jgi:hypothetical protein
MRSMILAAFAVLSLSTGAAYAQGVPPGFKGYVYGSKAFTGPNANSGQAAGTASAEKGAASSEKGAASSEKGAASSEKGAASSAKGG